MAAEREALAREMGSSVREMELFLRQAHTLPLHDVERERDVVRAELREIEARSVAAGSIGRGPGHDALGRGHLALQDPRSALAHFEAARDAGHRAPGLDYAMGLAQIGLYREALEKASRIQKASEREAYVARIEQEHRAPALVHLRAALSRGVESPEYAHGLVALYEGRLDDALAHAEAAFAAAPWLYEAKKLEGDVHAAVGGRSGHDKAFDHARATASFERAAEAYRAAADIARSDPAVHEAECDLWTTIMNAAAEHGDSMRPGFERAKTACERAIAASPSRPSGHLKLAWAHNCFSFWVATGHHGGESPEQALSQAAERVEAAARRAPDDAFASYLRGAVWRSQAIYAVEIGRDEGPALDRAVAGYEAALAADPSFLWALNEECATLAMRGEREARRGIDPTATFETALARCGRAVELDPDFMYPRASAIVVHIDDAERRRAAGASPAKAVERGLEAAAAARERSPSWRWIPFWRATLHRIQAEHDLEKGDDPGPALARARASLAELAAERASFPEVDAVEGEIAAVEAEALLARALSGGPPRTVEAELSAAVSAARAALGRAHASTPWDIGYALWLARVELTDLAYRLALGRAAPEHAEAALAPLAPFLSEPRDDPRLYQTAARAREARAELRRRIGQDDAPEIAAGVALAEGAVKAGPGLAPAHAVLGRCLLARARGAEDPAVKRADARRAAEALRAAVRLDPLLDRAHRALLEEAVRLAGAG